MGVDEYGHNHWNTTRSEMGELVYQLKYNGDKSAVRKIVDRLLGKFKGLETMDAIIPIPSTNKHRLTQPVVEIARELGAKLKVSVLENVLEKQTGGRELKNIDNPQERIKLLKENMLLSNVHHLAGQNVLLLDDLYRSGLTLSVATAILYEQAKVNNVYVLTMTKTRSNR